MSSIGGSGTLGDFTPEVVVRLLGPRPAEDRVTAGAGRRYRAESPEQWPTDKTGREYFHRGLARLLLERGGTTEAAASLRRDLEDGRLRALIIDDRRGDEHPVPPEFWRAALAGADMSWNGRAALGKRGLHFEGEIFLSATPVPQPSGDAPSASAAAWWPHSSQSLKAWATGPAAVREAEARLRAAGVSISEAAKARAMEAMSREAGCTWTASSIEATRRKGG